jgi:hypothetical protein
MTGIKSYYRCIIYSDSAWNPASFDITFKSEKDVHGFFQGSTITGLWPKLLKCCSYIAIFIVIGQFDSKINSIFGISTKSCIDLDSLHRKYFFTKNRPVVPLNTFHVKVLAVVPSRSIFRKKIFFLKYIWSEAIFCADFEYTDHFIHRLRYKDENR